MARLRRLLPLLLTLIVWSHASTAADAVQRALSPGLQIPAAAQPGPAFDVDKATEAYLNLLTPEQRARSDAYFEGRYWINFWSVLYTIAMMVLLVRTGASRRMRDIAERVSRRPFLNVLVYAAMFVVATWVLELPWSFYVGFVREHAYDLSNLGFGAWAREHLIGLAVSVPLSAIALTLIYAAIRRAGQQWWAWATALVFVFSLVDSVITPVFVAPLFNHYQPLPPGPVREAVLQLARANEIPTDHLEWFDASRQTTRVSANVSGIAGITRINLNDNLLNGTSLPEIKAVLGHEMGHYVLNHGFKLAVYLTLLSGCALLLVHISFERTLAAYGARWRFRNRADPAALPVLVGLFTLIWFLFSPLVNTTVRVTEAEADAFGINASREPHGFAMVSMRLSTYRKLSPGPLEEFLFYDHPSGYDRVHRSMAWLKENMR